VAAVKRAKERTIFAVAAARFTAGVIEEPWM
jgi:hypothetical protein